MARTIIKAMRWDRTLATAFIGCGDSSRYAGDPVVSTPLLISQSSQTCRPSVGRQKAKGKNAEGKFNHRTNFQALCLLPFTFCLISMGAQHCPHSGLLECVIAGR